MYSQHSYYHQQQIGMGNGGLISIQQPASIVMPVPPPTTSIPVVNHITLSTLPPPPPPPPQLPPTPPHMTEPNLSNTAVAHLVTHFSLVYQYYSGQEREQRAIMAGAKDGARAEAERCASWADFYADQSSRAAHHYNDIKEGRVPVAAALTLAPPPVKLPVAKPMAAAPIVTSSPKFENEPGKSVTSKSTASFKRFRKRNVAACQSKDERVRVKAKLKEMFRFAVSNHSLQTVDWDAEPLIPLTLPSSSSSSTGTGTVLYSPPDIIHAADNVNISPSSTNNSPPPLSSPPPATIVEGWKSDINGTCSGSGSIVAHQPNTSLPNCNLLIPTRPSKRQRRSDSQQQQQQQQKRNHHQELPSNDSYYGRGLTSDAGSVPSESTFAMARGQQQPEIAKGGGSGGGSFDDSASGDTNGDGFLSFSSYGPAAVNMMVGGISKKSKKYNRKTKKADTFIARTIVGPTNNKTSSKMVQRANRFAGRGGVASATSADLHLEYQGDNDRYMGKSVIGGGHGVIGNGTVALDEDDYERMTVKGTCQTLEKDYLRLTAPPRPELVRPQEVLDRHLSNLKVRWSNHVAGGRHDDTGGKSVSKGKDKYTWFCSQLKAIRQDLTVQRIFNGFAVDVYETHARIALKEGDLNEYNQSQTQLKELYDSITRSLYGKKEGDVGNDGRTNDVPVRTGLENHNEFIAYRIIYYVFLMQNQEYEGGTSDLFKIMLNLTPAQRNNRYVDHALRVRVSVVERDYHSFFRLRDRCPCSGAEHLMDYILPMMRGIGLRYMMRAYRPSVPLDFVLGELGFIRKGDASCNDEAEFLRGGEWLRECGCVFGRDANMIMARDTVLREDVLTGTSTKTSSLI